ESVIDNELPLSNVTLTTALSGADGLDAKIAPEYLRLKDGDDQPILLAWSTAIYAETEGRIRHGAILTDTPAQNDELGIEAVGFTGYPKDIRYTATRSRVKTEPLVEARHIWAHVQGHKRGNLGVKLDSTTSPVRIGTKSEDVEFQTGTGQNVSFEAGPYKMNWWTTHDLGSEFDKLAENTPFDYRMEHAWDG